MQKRLFQDKVAKSKKKLDDLKVVNYDDDNYFNDNGGGRGDDDDVDYNELKDTAGVKVIRFDEDIKRVFCSRNTSPFGYIAVVGVTKICIYLAYAEEVVAMYDHVMTLTQYDVRCANLGHRIDLLDFTKSCELFFTYSTQCTGDIGIWSLKNKKLKSVLYRLSPQDMPLSIMRTAMEDRLCVGYNRIYQKFILIQKSEITGFEAEVFRMNPSKLCNDEPLGECSAFEIDNSQQYIVAIFSNQNRLVVIDIFKRNVTLKIACANEMLLK